jgi:serine/threonine protein phosphatase PrpC
MAYDSKDNDGDDLNGTLKSTSSSIRGSRAESKLDDDDHGMHFDRPSNFQPSAAASLTSVAQCTVDRLVFKFTTLSDGNEQSSFSVTTKGTTIGRTSENGVFVPSDATLVRSKHAVVECLDGKFYLSDRTLSDHHAAVRVGVGRAARQWPLVKGACFSAGNSVFEVDEVSGGDDGSQPYMKLRAKTGPRKGSTIDVNVNGCTMGRANDNTVCISDRELSRRHSEVIFRDGQFYVGDCGSTNGTYVQLTGPYSGDYPLNLNDHILVGRTGFSVNRWDFAVSEEMGMRRTMEDKSVVVHDLVVPELKDLPELGPQSWFGVYDGHGGEDASSFLQKRLHVEVSLSLANVSRRLSSTLKLPSRAMAVDAQDKIVKEALTEAFLATDADFISRGGQAGSTATSVLVLGNRLYCANAGDSRTVLCRNNIARAMSEDHKPSREDEAARIKAAGGFVINKRVMGELAVSRAFGDAEFKKGISEILGEENVGRGEENPDHDLTQPLVVAEPEIQCVDLDEKDDFLILACDGLFDVMTNQAVCDMVFSEMGKHGDAQRTVDALSHNAIENLGSRDNVSILLVLLRDGWSRANRGTSAAAGRRN